VRQQRTGPITVAFCAWLLLVIGGSVAMISYATDPSDAGGSPPSWPADSAIERADGTFTALIFVHPHCPCTRASIAEFRRLLGAAATLPAIRVVMTVPPGVPDGWERDHLWRSLPRTLGVEPIVDRHGIETVRFGAATSGHVALYCAKGTLRFSGGITPARGHEGYSLGRRAMLEILDGAATDHDRTPVFGCPLLSSEGHACCLDAGVATK